MKLDQESLEAAARKAEFSGVVAIDVGHAREYELTAGFANRAFGIPISADMQFGIASGTKAFTALAIMQLVEAGSLSLDQRVRSVLGESLPLIDEQVTIQHLLEHISGMGDYLDEESDWEVTDYLLTVPAHALTTAESMLPLLEGIPQVEAPGERFRYNNGGYVVLGIVLERVTGEPFQDAIGSLVIEPAGLSGTGFLRLNELSGSVALGYLHSTGNLVNTLHLPVRGSPDGGGFTTASDLHLFWQALFAGNIVKPDTLRQMTELRHEDVEDGLGYGMGFYVHPSSKAVALMGYDAGQSFFSTHVPESNATYTVLGNTSEGAWPVAGRIAEHINSMLK